MGRQVSSSCCSNLGGFSNREGASKDRDFRGEREVGRGYREVSGGNSEPIDGV